MKKLIAVLLAAMLALGCCASALGENTKHERVYIVVGPDGEIRSLNDNIRLENKDGLEKITDASLLSDIQNMSGDETFTRDGDAIVWQANGKEIIYQGTSDKAPAILPSVTLTLDGKTVSAAELKNKTGEAALTVTYAMNDAISALAVTLLPLPTSGMTDIQAENAMIMAEAGQRVLVGYAVPGVDGSLKLPDHFTVSFHADHADLGWMMTFISADPIRLACKEIDSRMNADLRSIADLAASLLTALKNGEDLPMQPGLQNLKTNLVLSAVNDFFHTVNKADDSAKALRESAAGMTDSAKALANSVREAQADAKALGETLAGLQADSGKLNTQADALLASALQSANRRLSEMGLSASELTAENYASALEKTAKGLEGDAAEEIAGMKAQLDQTASFVKGMKACLDSVSQAAQKTDDLQAAVTNAADGANALQKSAAALQKEADKLQKNGTAKVKSTVATTTKQLAALALPYVENDAARVLDLYEQTRDQAQNGGYDLRPDGMQAVSVYVIRTDLQ